MRPHNYLSRQIRNQNVIPAKAGIQEKSFWIPISRLSEALRRSLVMGMTELIVSLLKFQKRKVCIIILFSLSIMFPLNVHSAAGTRNLLVNGGFDNTNPPLSGWKYNYEDTGNGNLASNHLFVAITNIAGAQKYALDLTANKWYLWTLGQGVMVDSNPVPVEPNGKYRLAVSARSTGCNTRIFVEGYRWRPGIKPHPKPELGELRKCYRFPLINFKGETPGAMSDVGQSWKRASITFPDGKLTPLAKENFDKIQFLVVHIIAIGPYDLGNAPDDKFFHLYVDDVVLERLN